MSQRIWLIRHGKSSRPFGVVDHQRPLSGRASDDAALIRDWLDDGPGLFIASTARRAVETAELLARKAPVRKHEDLYQGTPSDYLAVIEQTLAEADRVAFVGHNPTITDLVNHLANRVVTNNVPTLGAALFERPRRVEGGDWRLVNHTTPKDQRQGAAKAVVPPPKPG